MSDHTIRHLLSAVIAGTILSPALAAADSGMHGRVEIGVGNASIDNENPKHGEYTGIKDDDTYLIGAVSVEGGVDKKYLELEATDLGLDSRRIGIEIGEYGRYSFSYEHNETPHLIATGAKTPLDGAGGNTLTLPAGFTLAATPSAMPDLAGSLKQLDLETQRDADAVEFTTAVNNDWKFNFSYRQDQKEGIQSIGGTVGSSGGSRVATMLPQPIDYETDEIGASVAFARDSARLEIGYYLSQFSNRNGSLSWESPFVGGGAIPWASTATMGLPPDNEHQRVRISGGIDLPWAASRLTAVAETGEMTQNETLLPYSVNAALADGAGNAAPRATAQAAIDVTHLTVNYSSRPLPRLGVNARYRYYKTDNKTPYTLFDRVTADTEAQSLSSDTYSRPYDSSQATFSLDGTYHFGAGLGLRLGYEHDTRDRDYRAVEETTEDTLSARLSKRFGTSLSGAIHYARSERDAKDYDESRSYDAVYGAGTHAACAVASTTCFDNHPDIRQLDIASRDQDRLGLAVSFAPNEATDIGLSWDSTDEEFRDTIAYSDTYLGATDRKGTTVTLDGSYSPTSVFSLHAYYTRERLEMSQTGRAFNGAPAATKAAHSTDATRNWYADHEDDIDTIGLGGVFRLMEERLVVRANYTLTDETNNIRFRAGATFTPENLPEEANRRQTVALRGEYALRENTALGLGVEYEKFETKDWSRNGIAAAGTAIDDLLPLAGPLPDYDAWLVTASVGYRW